jgi:hypothetical protein
MLKPDPFLWRKRKSMLGISFVAFSMALCICSSIHRMWFQPGANYYPNALRIIILLSKMGPFVFGLILRLQIRKWVKSGDIAPNTAWNIDTDLNVILIMAYLIVDIN